MKTKNMCLFTIIFILIVLVSCEQPDREYQQQIQERIDQYEKVTLTTDLTWLSEKEREMIPVLITAADIIDEIFWIQAYGNKEHLKNHIEDSYAWEYALINYGPWGRLEGHTPFVYGFDDKPFGANFYPADMEREAFNEWDDPDKRSPFTMIRRTADGNLVSLPYADAFADQNEEIDRLLQNAADLAENEGLERYLRLLGESLKNDDYQLSDRAWMEMKDNNIDFIARPFDTGEDRKFGHKKAHSSYLVVKDHEWSRKLEHFADMIPQLQEGLPVPPQYRQESPGDDSEIFVYDAIYYAGHCNAGPKIIALHLPHDPDVTEETGTRSMQLRNVMEAKYEHILEPIADIVIHEDQRDFVNFDAFFHLTAFHEIAGGLGISRRIDGEGSVRDALREYYGIIDATNSDLMALYMINQLYEMGELTEQQMQEAYVTSFASIMRSSRFGDAGAHGTAAMIRFNFFAREEAFKLDEGTNSYMVDFENMNAAVEKLVEKLILLQGDGDYDAAREMIQRDGAMSETLQGDINRINQQDIPVDVYFDQGMEHLHLN